MVIGNVVGSNVANLSLVFGSTLMVLSFKNVVIRQDQKIHKDLLILLLSCILVWAIIAINPFSIISSFILLGTLLFVITFWYQNGKSDENEETKFADEKNIVLKLFSFIIFFGICSMAYNKRSESNTSTI